MKKALLFILCITALLFNIYSCERDNADSLPDVADETEFRLNGNNYVFVKNSNFKKDFDITLKPTEFAEQTKTKINSKLKKVDYYSPGAFRFDSSVPGSVNVITGTSGTTSGGEAVLMQLGLYPSVNAIYMSFPSQYSLESSANDNNSQRIIFYKTYNNIPVISEKTKIEIMTEKNKLSKIDYCWSGIEAAEKSGDKELITARKAAEVYDEFIRAKVGGAESLFKDKNIVIRPVFAEIDNGFTRAFIAGEAGGFYGSLLINAETAEVISSFLDE